MLRNMKLSLRLGLAFGIMILLTVLVGAFALTKMNELSRINQDLFEHPFAVKSAVLSIERNVIMIHRAMKDAVMARTKAELEASSDLVRNLEKEIKAEFEIIEGRFLGQPRMYNEARDLIKGWRPIRQKVLSHIEAGGLEEAADVTKGEGNEHVLKITGSLQKLRQFAENKASSFYQASQVTSTKAFQVMYLVIAVAIVVGVAFTVLITRSILVPTREIVRASEAIAQGSLQNNIGYSGTDEMGRMAESLRRMISGVIGQNESIKRGIMGPLWTADRDLTVTYLNPAAAGISEALTGLTAQKILGKKKVAEALGDAEGLVDKMVHECLIGSESREGDISFDLGGRELFLHQMVSPLSDLDGRVMGVVGIGLDITARKAIELEKSQLADQLRQAQKMESIGTLAGGVAHDFNNMLSAIMGYTELALSMLPENAPPRQDLERVMQVSLRASKLVGQLLAFSRKQLLQMRTFNLNDLVLKIKPMLERIIGEDIELQIVISPDLDLVRADFHQMEQILMNLLTNARDALPTGGKVTIETGNTVLDESYVASHPEAKVGPYVMLAVSDNGPGMAPEIRDNIFEPFFTTKEIGSGTGLGLSMVHGIVKQHGGTIYVYSEPGHGTTMKIYLPRAESEQVSPGPVVGDLSATSGSETILVVEDDGMVRDFLYRALNGQGYTVHQAADAREAEEIVRSQDLKLDLLLTDVIMPQASGKELFDRLSKELPELKVLYISGYTDNVIAHHGVLDQGVNFLQKPVGIARLANMVRKILDD